VIWVGGTLLVWGTLRLRWVCDQVPSSILIIYFVFMDKIIIISL
jgi:hypothetical protein